LPHLVAADRMGRLSGFGWGMGYVGGLVALFAVLAVSRPELIGITPPPGEALFGLSRATYQAERLVGPASALWLAVFVLPMFLFTPDAPRRPNSVWRAAAEGAGALIATLRRIAHFRNPALFLLAFMTYNNGLAAVIAFGGIYAAGIFGWGTTELGIFGIILTIFAAFGAFGGGWLDDRLGSRATVLAAVAGVTAASLGIMSISRDSALFFLALAPRAADAALFASVQERLFLVFAILLGVGMGPMQAASRTLVARLAPAGMAGEFFGLFALSGRATAFLAPFLVALATDAFASQRAGLMVVLAFLAAGFVLMLPVREEQAGPPPG
jgi:UMF1 family MFS transporter